MLRNCVQLNMQRAISPFFCKFKNFNTYNTIGDCMGDKAAFKDFVRENPNLIKYVKEGKKTWQDFFELFSLYGTSDSVWNEYLGSNVSSQFDFVSWLKGIDLDGVQDGIASIQRVLGVVQDFTNKDSVDSKDDYQPRPLYKHFED